MIASNIEEIIERDGQVLEMTYGVSMQPMLRQGQNPVVISKVVSTPKKHAVILFKDSTGKYILHRIIKVTKDGFVTRGDNLFVTESVASDGVLGVLTGYYKGEKYIDCEKNFGYRVYSFFTPMCYVFRKTRHCIGRFAPNFVKKIYRKIFK
ncbi:MAG: S24/S26 family peptidase [Clostridia bacterium]|nr:S24/S26 family peptidase [Clostridia bacterium]